MDELDYAFGGRRSELTQQRKKVMLNKINPSTAGLPYPQKKKSVAWKQGGRGETMRDTEMTVGDEVGGDVRQLGAFVRRPLGGRGNRKGQEVDWRVLINTAIVFLFS
jgi:hypothetical protein